MTMPPGPPGPPVPPTPPPAPPPGPPPDWWQASDGRWYPPPRPGVPLPPATVPSPTAPPAGAPSAAASLRRRRNPKIIAIAGACVVILVAALVFVLTRGGGGSDGSGGGPSAGASGSLPSGPDALPDKSITLASDVVVIRGRGGATVKSVGADGHSFVLDGAVAGVDALRPGKVALLTGITAVKVDSASKHGNDVLVSFEPATLPDVVQDGSFDWSDRTVDLSKAVVLYSPQMPLTSDPGEDTGTPAPTDTPAPAPTDTAGPGPTGSAGPGPTGSAGPGPTGSAGPGPTGSAAPSATVGPSASAGSGTPQALAAPVLIASSERRAVTGKLGPLAFAISFEPSAHGAEIDLQLTKVGDLSGSADVDVKLAPMHSSGSARVSGGNVSQFSMNVDKLAGTADISVSLQASKNVDALKTPPFLKLPVKIQVPFPIAGIPFTYTLSSTIQVQLSVAIAGDGIAGKAHVSFGGDAGFSFDNGSLTLTGNRTQDSPNSVATLRGGSSGPVGIVLTAEVPKVELGLYALQTGAGVYLSSGLSTAMQILGGSAVQCRGIQQAYVLAAGVQAKFLGIKVKIARKAIVDQRWQRFVPNTPQCSGG